MNSLVKCYEADGEITLLFEKNINSSSESNNFSISSGSILSINFDGNKIVLIPGNVTVRPLVINCTVEDTNAGIGNFSRIVARELNYKVFNSPTNLCDYYLQNQSTDLDGKLYYDAVDCNLYYDSLGQQPATDLNGNLLAYIIDENLLVESEGLVNGNCPGWKLPVC